MATQSKIPLATTEKIPLTMFDDDVIRVGNTRVTLDTIVIGFMEGATAEEIAQQYPSVSLPDIYSVIGYYLHRRSEVEAYLSRRKIQAEQVRHRNEDRFDPRGIRKRLLARQENRRP